MIKTNCTVMKTVFSQGGFKILSCKLNEKNDEIILNKFGNFTIKGDTWLETGDKVTLNLSPNKLDERYGMSYDIVASKVDLDNLDDIASKTLMCEITTEKQATEVLKHYPNFVQIVMEHRENEIDVKKLYDIGEFRLDAYVRKLRKRLAFVKVKALFPQYELSDKECKEMLKIYHGDMDEMSSAVRKNPYAVFVFKLSRDFEIADRVIIKTSPKFRKSFERAEALIYYVLKLNEDGGSTAIQKSDVLSYAKQLNNELKDNVADALTQSPLFHVYPTDQVSLMETHVAEQNIADWCKQKLLPRTPLKIPSNFNSNKDSINLSDEQINAVKKAFEHELSIICGKSGTGKSSTIKKLLECIEKDGYGYSIISPTGKAAKRVTEITGVPAQTIHRAVASGTILDDFLIIDEMSMADLMIFSKLIGCIAKPYCHVVLIGDNAQLLPIGCGNIFNDMINSEIIPLTNLTKVFRYDDKGVEYVATNIHQGTPFLTKYETQRLSDNYLYIETDNEVDTIVKEYTKLIDKGVSPNDILCLSPYNIGECGSFVINNRIRDILNPPTKKQKVIGYYRSKTLIEFKIGDIVLCKKNDYEPEFYDEEKQNSDFIVVNGQDGVVHDIEDDKIIIDFEGNLIVYPKKRLNELLLGYCISVHSSQGSEADYVLSITSKKHSRMLNRNMCYVSSTRSKGSHIEIGSIQAMNQAIKINGNEMRETKLYDLLRGDNDENE